MRMIDWWTFYPEPRLRIGVGIKDDVRAFVQSPMMRSVYYGVRGRVLTGVKVEIDP